MCDINITPKHGPVLYNVHICIITVSFPLVSAVLSMGSSSDLVFRKTTYFLIY